MDTTAGRAKQQRESHDQVVDDTAPGEDRVVVDATEARASEPVLADEEALTKDTPPPADAPRGAKPASTAVDTRSENAPTTGAGDYVGDPNAPTARPGEAEFDAAARVPSDDDTTEDGIRYADVRNPRSEEERLEKREIELGAEMDYVEHRRTYNTFMNATKYGTAIVVALLIAMAVGFFTAGSFLGGIMVFIGAVLASIWFFR